MYYADCNYYIIIKCYNKYSISLIVGMRKVLGVISPAILNGNIGLDGCYAPAVKIAGLIKPRFAVPSIAVSAAFGR